MWDSLIELSQWYNSPYAFLFAIVLIYQIFYIFPTFIFPTFDNIGSDFGEIGALLTD